MTNTNSKPLDFLRCHNEESYNSIFGIDEIGQELLYNETIENLNIILDNVKERYNFLQYGAKSGELYYTHAVKGIHYILQLQELLINPTPQKSEQSLKLLKLFCLSYLIHDLNKFEWNKGKPRSELWSIETINSELNDINLSDCIIDNFFPEWKDYINDIYILILGHSRIHRYSGRLVFSDIRSIFGIDTSILNTKLSKDQLSKGINIMQLVDLLDLIKDLSFQKVNINQVDKEGNDTIGTINQGEILKHCQERLSYIIGETMVFERVSITMNTSKFSNVMLNSVIEILGEEYDIFPLLIFTSGAIIFGKREDMLNTSQKENLEIIKEKIAERFVQIIDKLIMTKINEKGFLYSITGQGVKIGDYIFQQPNERNKMKKMLNYFAQNLEPFAYKEDIKNRKKSSRHTSVKKSAQYINESIKNNTLIEIWEDGENWELIGEDILWRMARFCHTVFIAILKLYDRKMERADQIELMEEFLKRLEIFKDLSEIYDQSNNISQWYRYGFFHFIGFSLFKKDKTIEDIAPIMIDYVLDKMDSLIIEDNVILNPKDFINNYIHLFREETSSSQLIQKANPNNNILCTVCGKRMKSLGTVKKDQKRYKWYSEYVPEGISVQKFSNFKIAGEKKEPVRMICDLCRWRFYLEKIMSLVSGKFAMIYSTFYFPDGHPFAIIRGVQRTLESLKDKENLKDDVKAFMVDFKIFKNNLISIRPQKAYGFALPAIPQEICGSIPLPWKIEQKQTVNEQYWSLIKQILAITSQLRLKAIVSKLKNDYEELLGKSDVLIQDIPVDYKWLFGNKSKLSFKECKIILEIMIILEDLINLVIRKDKEKHCIALLKYLAKGNIKSIHYLDTLIRSPSSTAKGNKYKTKDLRQNLLTKLNEIKDLKSKLIKL